MKEKLEGLSTMNKLNKFLCAIGIHDWIYTKLSTLTKKRYCPCCRRQEEQDGYSTKFYRIKDVSIEELYN